MAVATLEHVHSSPVHPESSTEPKHGVALLLNDDEMGVKQLITGIRAIVNVLYGPLYEDITDDNVAETLAALHKLTERLYDCAKVPSHIESQLTRASALRIVGRRVVNAYREITADSITDPNGTGMAKLAELVQEIRGLESWLQDPDTPEQLVSSIENELGALCVYRLSAEHRKRLEDSLRLLDTQINIARRREQEAEGDGVSETADDVESRAYGRGHRDAFWHAVQAIKEYADKLHPGELSISAAIVEQPKARDQSESEQ